MIGTKIQRAYIKLVTNKKARTSSSKKYFQVYSENGTAYLFTQSDMEKALNRAKRNPEDTYPVQFTEPEAKVVEKEVVKYIEVKSPGIFSKIANFFK